jgi:[ribosomal protein S5]-alanine N-acetyltransferase
MQLIAITETIDHDELIRGLPPFGLDIVQVAIDNYSRAGYQPPWISYLAKENDRWVGTCAFKGPPASGRVEIAFFTFPGNEGNGVATRMVHQLIHTACRMVPQIQIYAHTWPAEVAPTIVLGKLGFRVIKKLNHHNGYHVREWELSLADVNPIQSKPR